MKKISILFLTICLFATQLSAQEKKAPAAPEAPYKKDIILPSFNILSKDSTYKLNTADIPKGKFIALVYFDPNCHHCIEFVEKLMPAMDSLKHVNFYFSSPVHELSFLRQFYDKHNFKKYKNIKIVGRDIDFFFISHYQIQRFPAVAIYNKQKKFVKLVEGDATTPDAIYDAIH